MPQASPSDHRKPCTLCLTPRDVLVRCQIDETGKWHFVCPGACWKDVSGGVVDGDKSEQHQHYRYGGMWKNKHEAVSAKKPKAKKKIAEGPLNSTKDVAVWSADAAKYTKNDRAVYQDTIGVCRKSHISQESQPPDQAHSLWKDKSPVSDTIET